MTDQKLQVGILFVYKSSEKHSELILQGTQE